MHIYYYAHGILYVTNIIIANGNVTFTSVTLDPVSRILCVLSGIFKLTKINEVVV